MTVNHLMVEARGGWIIIEIHGILQDAEDRGLGHEADQEVGQEIDHVRGKGETDQGQGIEVEKVPNVPSLGQEVGLQSAIGPVQEVVVEMIVANLMMVKLTGGLSTIVILQDGVRVQGVEREVEALGTVIVTGNEAVGMTNAPHVVEYKYFWYQIVLFAIGHSYGLLGALLYVFVLGDCSLAYCPLPL